MSLFIVLPAVPFVLAVLAFFHFRESSAFPARLARGVGWVSLWALPGVLFQAWWLFGSGQTSYRVDVSEYARVAPIAWWVLIGGGSVQAVFESTVGPRQTTMITEWPSYYGWVWLQTLLLAALVAWRLRGRRGVKDPLIIAVALFALANAWFGRAWPWWGS